MHGGQDATVIVFAHIRGEKETEALEAAATLWDHDVSQTDGWKGNGYPKLLNLVRHQFQ